MRQALRTARKDRGLSCDGLGRLLGVSRWVVIRWESGRRTPSVDVALRVAKMLGLSPEVAWGVDLSDVAPLQKAI